MNWLKTSVFAAILLCAAAPAFADDLTGVWQGVFWGEGNQPTAFQVTLRDDPGPAFSGSSVEGNNFGDTGSPFLLATLQGELDGKELTFVKTYDGTGSVSHSINYSGVMVSERHIVGTWTAGAVSGQFEMAR